MIVIGSMIGSGIFIVSAESSALVGALGWLLAAWAIAGMLTIAGTRVRGLDGIIQFIVRRWHDPAVANQIDRGK